MSDFEFSELSEFTQEKAERLAAMNSRESGRAPAWLTSMGDLIALMLTFFVLLFSLSSLETNQKISILTSQIESASDIRVRSSLLLQRNVSAVTFSQSFASHYFAEILRQKLDSDVVLSRAFITNGQDWVAISLPQDVLFLEDGFDLSSNGRIALAVLGDALAPFEARYDIVGHTSPGPVASYLLQSRWELGLWRAVAVDEALKTSSFTHETRVVSHADGAVQVLEKTLSEAQKNRLANRVDILVLRNYTNEANTRDSRP